MYSYDQHNARLAGCHRCHAFALSFPSKHEAHLLSSSVSVSSILVRVLFHQYNSPIIKFLIRESELTNYSLVITIIIIDS